MSGTSCVWWCSTLSCGKILLFVATCRRLIDHRRVALLLSLIVYIMAARVIYKKRDELRGFLNPWNESPFANTVTTEIKVTTEDKAGLTGNAQDEGQPVGFEPENETSEGAYTVNIEVGRRPSRGVVPAALHVRSVTRDVAANEANAEAWLYARVAFLFFFALAITCKPSDRPIALMFRDSWQFCQFRHIFDRYLPRQSVLTLGPY